MLDTQDDIAQDILVYLTEYLKGKHNKFLSSFAEKLYKQLGAIHSLKELEAISETCPENQILNLKRRLFFSWAQAWRKQNKLQMIREVAVHELGESEAREYLKTCYSNGDPDPD